MAGLKAWHPLKRLKQLLKPILPSTLYGRSQMILLIPGLLVASITTYVFVDRYWESVTQTMAQHIAGDVAATVSLMQESDSFRENLEEFAHQHFDLSFQIVPKDIFMARQKTLPKPKPVWGHSLLKQALKEHLTLPHRTRIYEEHIEIIVILDTKVIVLETPRKRLLNKTTPIFLMWLLGTPLVFFIIAWLFLRNQIRPLRRLVEAANRFGKGQEIEEFKAEGAFEVRQAAEAFNKMRTRIARQLKQRIEMLAGISHDLRTPLTRMELGLALLGESSSIDALRQDVKDMSRMIDAYLSFARGEDAETSTRTSLNTLLQRLTSKRSPQENARIHLSTKSDLHPILRPQAMERCLTNLIENALRHAENLWIDVSEAEDPFKIIEITIDDDGPGIPENLRQEAFRPFHRLDSARNLDHGGVGLGLSIAKDCIHQHGGQIHLAEAPQGGLRIKIIIPM